MAGHVLCHKCGLKGLMRDGNPCPRCGVTTRVLIFDEMPGRAIVEVYDDAPPISLVERPNILLQSVVTLGSKTQDGDLIEAVRPAWVEIAKMIAADPSVMYKIAPRKWEELIAGWYERLGFRVTLTPRSGDFGRDVIAEKSGVLSVRFVDQVKAYAPNHRVPANDVRALIGVLVTDRSASKGLVTTTSDFAPGILTDPSIQPYVPTRLELVNGLELRKRLAAEAAKQV